MFEDRVQQSEGAKLGKQSPRLRPVGCVDKIPDGPCPAGFPGEPNRLAGVYYAARFQWLHCSASGPWSFGTPWRRCPFRPMPFCTRLGTIRCLPPVPSLLSCSSLLLLFIFPLFLFLQSVYLFWTIDLSCVSSFTLPCFAFLALRLPFIPQPLSSREILHPSPFRHS